MKQVDFPDILLCPDGHEIPLYKWFPSNQSSGSQTPVGIVQIGHGMAEHAGRYQPFASYLNQLGFIVVAHDHRGHGKCISNGIAGHFADREGWSKVVADVNRVAELVKGRFPELPHFLFAHSMGSFISLGFLQQYRPKFQGIILSGSNYSPPAKFAAGYLVAKLEKKRIGGQHASKLLQFISFGSFNNAFKPLRTESDWLSRDPLQVDAYVHDPLCGFAVTTQLWCDFLKGLESLSSKSGMQKIQKDQPILLMAGDQDPVGSNGKGVRALCSKLEDAGCHQVECKLYPEGRHEMLNEINNQEVFRDCAEWISKQLPEVVKRQEDVELATSTI